MNSGGGEGDDRVAAVVLIRRRPWWPVAGRSESLEFFVFCFFFVFLVFSVVWKKKSVRSGVRVFMVGRFSSRVLFLF